MLSFTAIIEAGSLRQEDEKLMFIQGLSAETAGAVAEWLAVATGTKVTLRHIDAIRMHDIVIRREPSDAKWVSLPNNPGARQFADGNDSGTS